MTCVCNDTGRVLATRDKRTVEAACARCTARRAAIESENARMDRALDEADARLAAIVARVDAIAKRIDEQRKEGAS